VVAGLQYSREVSGEVEAEFCGRHIASPTAVNEAHFRLVSALDRHEVAAAWRDHVRDDRPLERAKGPVSASEWGKRYADRLGVVNEPLKRDNAGQALFKPVLLRLVDLLAH